jgi:hypothetical protein
MGNRVDVRAPSYLGIVQLNPTLIIVVLKAWLEIVGLGCQKALDGSEDRFQSQHRRPLLVGLPSPSAIEMINDWPRLPFIQLGMMRTLLP